MVSVVCVEPAIDLLAGDQCGHNRLTKEMVLHAAGIVGESKQEIREAEAREAGQAGTAEGERTARDVGLCVVVAPDLKLKAEL